MDSYIIVGHGEEEQLAFESRKRIPPGYTLVTLAECGTVTESEEVSRIVEAFGTPNKAHILQNPVEHIPDIQSILNGHSIHCYTEGMYYPNMFVHLLADWESVTNIPRNNKQIIAVKSGVYEFPLSLEHWRLRDSDTFEKSMYGSLDVTGHFNPSLTNYEDVANRIYGDSLVPRSEEALGVLQEVKGNLGKFRKRLVFSLDQIFEKCGPGVYYYVICRSPKNNTFSYYINSNIGLTIPKHIMNARNKIKYIPELMPRMEELARKKHTTVREKLATEAVKKGESPNTYTPTTGEKHAAEGWNYETITEAPTKYTKLYENTMRIRRASLNQQSLHGKNRRRTRRATRRARRKTYRQARV